MVSVGSQIGAALLTGASPVGLLIGTVVGESIATSILSTDIRERFRHLLPNSHFWTTVWDNIYRFRNFPLYTAPYSFAGVCAKRLLFLLLGVYATTNEVGLYAIAVKLTRLPASLVSSAIKPVIFQMAARELGSGRVERLVVRLLMLETIFGAPVLVFFLFNARWVFGIVFGDAWAAAGTYAMWLALPAFTRLLASWPDRVFDITGRQRLALLMEVLYDILSLALFGLSLAWLNSVKWAVGLHSSVTALYYLILVVVAFRVAKFSLRGLWRIAAIFLGIVSVAGAVHWAVLILFPKIAAVTIYVALMGAYYAYLVFRFRKRRASPFRGRY